MHLYMYEIIKLNTRGFFFFKAVSYFVSKEQYLLILKEKVVWVIEMAWICMVERENQTYSSKLSSDLHTYIFPCPALPHTHKIHDFKEFLVFSVFYVSSGV